jgi:16S rRNA (cytidine1402-2'-O)-methyltransferase
MGEGKRAPTLPGCLYLVGTPIGNLEDLSYRAVRVLSEVDLIAAEDTRSARVLCDRYGITTPTISYHKDNEARRAEELCARLREKQAVALISEAGMPGISDPGARLVTRCLEEGIEIDMVPGPSASLAALVLSGLPSERFSWIGFLPRGGAERRRALAALAEEPATLVLFEAPLRVAATLVDLGAAFGADRRCALARELTKLHQEIVRGTLSELALRYAESPPRGEVTLVVAGAPAPAGLSEEELLREVERRLGEGESPRTIAHGLAAEGRRRVYQLALALAAKTSSRQP